MSDGADFVRAEVELENLLGVTPTWTDQPARPLMPGDVYLRPVSLRLGLLAAEAHRRELLSEGQLARLLRLDRVDLRKILDAAGIDDSTEVNCVPDEAEGPGGEHYLGCGQLGMPPVDMTGHYTYRVTWSPDDGEYIGLCAEFPSLSWLAATDEEALSGIRELVREVLADIQRQRRIGRAGSLPVDGSGPRRG